MEDSAILSENNLNIKKIIAEIVGIPDNDNWKVFDSKPEHGLYLIHYNPNSNMYEYGQLRGVVVDINEKRVICNAYKYTPVVKSDKIEFEKNGNLILHDELGRTHISHKDKIKIVPGFEVVTIRVFLHHGNIYYSTYKKIEIWNSDSHWGDSDPFDKMCLDLNIPQADVLFPDKTKQYSNFAYIFMLVHPGVLNVSKISLNKGFIVYGGAKNIWDLSATKLDPALVVSTPIDLKPTSELSEAIKNTSLYAPEGFTVKQAESFLKHGYYTENYKQPDNKLDNGEFVIVYMNNTDDLYSNVVRIESTSYRWRSIMKDNKPNLRNQLWRLFDYRNVRLFDESEYIDYTNKFPIFEKYAIDSIIKKIDVSPIHFWPGKLVAANRYATTDDLLYNIWVTFIMIVPLHRQKEVAGLYKEFSKNKQEIVEFLFTLSKQDKLDFLGEEVDPDKRILKLLELSRNRALGNINKHGVHLVPSKDTQTFLQNNIKSNLDFLVGNEMGKSLYKIYKKMTTFELTYKKMTTFDLTDPINYVESFNIENNVENNTAIVNQ
jgi:hypothetical protein